MITELSELKELILAIHENLDIVIDIEYDEVLFTIVFNSSIHEIAYITISTEYSVVVFLENRINKHSDDFEIKKVRKSLSAIVKVWCNRHEYEFDQEV